MKVKQLIKELQKLPADAVVVLSSDGEGNQYSPLADVGEYKYVEQNSWCGDIYPTDEEEGGVDAVVFWPTN